MDSDMAERVDAELRATPGEWAWLARTEEPRGAHPWWEPINMSDEFEVRVVPITGLGAYGPCEVYARFIVR
jgi:hypothetical protein